MSTISSSTTSTTAYKVTADTTGTLVIQTGATPTTAVTVDASQNVGIGTTSPSYKLQVAGSIKETQSSEAATAGNVQSTFAASFQRTSTDTVFNIGYATTPDAWILSASYGTTGAYKPIAFATSDTERMRIDSSGNVGIGTASPSSFGSYKYLTVAGSNATSGGVFESKSSDNSLNAQFYVGSGAASLQVTSNIPLLFLTNNSERMRIDSSGNVGIGTSSPGFKLELVNGYNNGLNIKDSTGTVFGGMFVESGQFAVRSRSNHPLVFSTNDVIRASIDTSGNFQFNSGYGSVATAYGCRAWVNFNGTGTVAIRSSGNVSSITDNGVGLYTVNFTNAMPDTNYATVGTCNFEVDVGIPFNSRTAATGSVGVETYRPYPYNTPVDVSTVSVSIFR